MAILAPEASYDEFCLYVQNHWGEKSRLELAELWERRQKLLSLKFDTQRGWRERALAADEQHLTNREREQKVIAEAKAQGRNIEKV
tara:strand:- start:46 stop:303 length:258 start_codon:yes stop_codon:yes gene_type:complete